MSPRLNLLIQITAVFVFVAFRLAAPGWWLVILVMSLVGPLVMLLPSILAAATVRRPRLCRAVAVPFLGCATGLVVAGALFPDFDDQRSYVPLLKVLGVDDGATGLIAGIGGVAVLMFLLCAALTPVAIGMTTARDTGTARPASRVAASR